MTIVISESMDASGLDLLRSSSASVIYRPDGWEHPNFLAKVLASASAWIVRNQTKVESPFIMPALKVVGRLGVGLDNLDLRTLFAHGVAVVSARGANATAVAEYVIACCLYHRRPLPSYHRDLVATGWHRDRAIGREVFGATMGLIGMGDISRRVAVKASALGMRVIGFDPYVSPHDVAWMELGVESMDLESLCRQADFVSVHIPKTPQTLGLIGEEALSWMKPETYLIQTSRGGIVDEDALFSALQDGRLAGAALDVRAQEPPTDRRFEALPNVILTPHVAGLSQEAGVRTSVMVAEDVLRVLRGERARGLVSSPDER